MRRRLALDNHTDLQAWLLKVELKAPRKSAFLERLNEKVLRPTRMYASALDQLDVEIKNLPSPSSMAQVERCVTTLEEAQPKPEIEL